MSFHLPKIEDKFLTRREMLCRSGMGMAAMALADLMGQAGLAQASPVAPSAHAATLSNPLSPKLPPLRATAKRVIHIFLNGGASQVDTFDPKPMLNKYDGKPLPMPNLTTERKTGAAYGSVFKFKKHGQSGIDVSELFPNLATCVDDVTVIRSMYADIPNHEPSLLLMNCGEARQIRPSFGSWLTYGLGTENQNLPAFVAMCPGGYPIQGAQNWQSGFLPGIFQGTYVNSDHAEVEKLIENVRNNFTTNKAQRRELDLLQTLNNRHAERRQRDAQLEARVQSFELAYRMQDEVTEAFDVTREPEHIRKLYGNSKQSRQLLIARRLVERGVRFVQLWHGNSQPWDSHDNLVKAHGDLSKECDQGIAALLKDLKQRGMLDETLVLIGGEFGRTPVVEITSAKHDTKNAGRDHNHHGFSLVMAGGGTKAGYIHGATDEFGFKAVEKPVHVHDLHATMLRMLGFDHEKFTYRYAGRDFRLTDVHGRVVHDLIA